MNCNFLNRPVQKKKPNISTSDDATFDTSHTSRGQKQKVGLHAVGLNVESDQKYRIGRRNVESDIRSGRYIHL